MTLTDTATTDRLLNAVRHVTGIDDLDWARAPQPLAGGFWAEMYVVEFADPPEHLAGRLVARIMPDPTTAARETAVQQFLELRGFPVPAVRAASGPTSDLERPWMLMDHAPGRPLLSGLSAAGTLVQAPTLLRRLPDLLASAAARLHRCSTDGLDVAIDDHAARVDIEGSLERVARQATSIDRHDLASTAEHLATRAPSQRVICHGDLHPFNLLVDDDRWALIDWSTAVTADPHYDLAFSTLVLANPPLGGAAPLRTATRFIGTRLANRFLRTYRQLAGTPINSDRLAWGRSVHALRAIVELTTWEAQGRMDEHRGHPWLMLRPTL